MYMSILWILVVSTSLPYLLLPNAVYFASRPGGVIMLSAGALAEYAASQNVVINLITIITCTICYVACYLRIRDPQDGYRVVDRSLFFCALFSSLPFCAEVVRCLLALATFEVKNELYEISIELWLVPIMCCSFEKLSKLDSFPSQPSQFQTRLPREN
ncbi:unnamed protein product [Cylicostephanus goldi]|uniref:Serpentine receptor class gamma n=1 Tax=Cylicostephanus goldi TaxID=71465 RepID=A0A3P6RM36_CYLGO|nr:unnamed protein product [Cylicostephanus goldi]